MKNFQMALTPLGAGDLIDRAVRFYRQNFWTFIWIAAPPILAGTMISVLWTILGRTILVIDRSETALYYIFLWLGNIFIWLVEAVATLTVMGGASRNFVRHLLFGEPVTFRETYRNTKSRFFGLVGASLIITFLLAFVGYIILNIGFVIGFILIALAIVAFSFSPFLATMVSIVLALVVIFFSGWLFFLLASRFVYVPQVMLVEGQGVFSAMGRSASLASGNVKRLAGLVVFTILAIFSALALFYVPLGWYAWVNGIEIFNILDPDAIPAWYEIAGQFVWQMSLILLMPVWMVGLCLLYVDERVRHEGYDIELMAARRLGEIPAVPIDYINPLQPALAQQIIAPIPQPSREKTPFTTLGLK